jgi:hypothetical protein
LTGPEAARRDRDPAAARHWARSIGVDTKTKTLLTALDIGFRTDDSHRRGTQGADLHRVPPYAGIPEDLPESNGYHGQVVLFNGSNSGPEATPSTSAGSRKTETAAVPLLPAPSMCVLRSSNTSATKATILLATEAAAEGINLQFCSLVINYDLPWNPQRIEQRIGRCHRYGQSTTWW